jgi:hypothetical protein
VADIITVTLDWLDEIFSIYRNIPYAHEMQQFYKGCSQALTPGGDRSAPAPSPTTRPNDGGKSPPHRRGPQNDDGCNGDYRLPAIVIGGDAETGRVAAAAAQIQSRWGIPVEVLNLPNGMGQREMEAANLKWINDAMDECRLIIDIGDLEGRDPPGHFYLLERQAILDRGYLGRAPYSYDYPYYGQWPGT